MVAGLRRELLEPSISYYELVDCDCADVGSLYFLERLGDSGF